jgi:hypothetical protein
VLGEAEKEVAYEGGDGKDDEGASDSSTKGGRVDLDDLVSVFGSCCISFLIFSSSSCWNLLLLLRPLLPLLYQLLYLVRISFYMNHDCFI